MRAGMKVQFELALARAIKMKINIVLKRGSKGEKC